MTRRLYLLLVFDWLFFWRRYDNLADIRFRRVRNGEAPIRYLLIHGNEETAREVLKHHMKSHRGTAYLVTGDHRYVIIRGATIDPNRLFSREGAEKSLRALNKNWPSARIGGVLDYLDRERPKLIHALVPPPGGLLIATHNNSQGYSVKDELAISDKISIRQESQPHEFFLCTDSRDFERIARGPYNVVLQKTAPAEDDGSLSRLAAKAGIRYVNLEVALGKAPVQQEMLEWLMKTLA